MEKKDFTKSSDVSFLKEYDDILMPEELQKILHVSRNAIYAYLRKGTIRSLKIGNKYRIPKLYLLEFMYPGFSTK